MSPVSQMDLFEEVHFIDDNKDVTLNLDPDAETIWATQDQMGQLFGKDVRTISEHIQTIFKEGELDEESVVRKFRISAANGKSYRTNHYSLDVILSVGYRVSSQKATKFRQWATQTLKQYILEGYVVNETRLREDPEAQQSLVTKVRKLRTTEKNIYSSVREAFKIGAKDYNEAIAAKGFFANLQDRFLYAVTQHTSAELVIDRANHLKENMGLQYVRGLRPTLTDAKTGKNYLEIPELERLHLVCEQWLNMIEGYLLRNIKVPMADLSDKFNQMLSLNDYPIFKGYKTALRSRANAHAKRELEAYRQRMRLEARASKQISKAS